MFRHHPSMTALTRVLADSGWQDFAPLRWLAQLLVGGLPGIVVCLVIRWMAGSPTEQGSGAHIASIVPILSASGLSDSAAFHRLKFKPSAAAGFAPQFRIPSLTAATEGNELPAAAQGTTSTVDFNAPRTEWKHLSAKVRAEIDASLAKRRDWTGVVLHGSRANHGNASLLNRYDTKVRGLKQGLAYHFVIGNGAGAVDGAVETGDRWSQAADAEPRDSSISVCLVGDFNTQSPSKAQLEAVNELTDYLSIKLGKMELTNHRSADGRVSSCLGSKFVVLTRP